ncbi:MAG TPA: lysine decarboxylase, partial [bacterium]|nr:lysine decarboxylase [bacterium]
VVMYGSEYWNEVLNFDKMVDWGVISAEDLQLFHKVDDVESAFTILKNHFETNFLNKQNHNHGSV